MYCEPILNLAGFYVEIISTDSEGYARRYVEELPKLPNAILIAGGDGTVSEVITGLFRRSDNKTCPVGVLPVGRTNSIGKKLIGDYKTPKNNLEEANLLAKAAITIVRGQLEKKDAMKIELIDDENALNKSRAIYSVGSIQWGAFRDIKSKRDKYWYTDGFREYFALIINSFSNEITWNCKASLTYTDPCRGCKNCRSISENTGSQNKRWWAKFVPLTKPVIPSGIDYTKIINDKCNETHRIEIESTEFELNTESNDKSTIPKLIIKLSGILNSGFDYMFNAWGKIHKPYNESNTNSVIEAKTIEILPQKNEAQSYYSIDNEDFEVKPIRVSVLPEAIQMFVLRN